MTCRLTQGSQRVILKKEGRKEDTARGHEARFIISRRKGSRIGVV